MKSDILLQQVFSMESGLTLSYQLTQFIRRMIDGGELETGDLIPTEEAFCRAYDISRSTVRRALESLVEEGLLNRVRGKGTFVSGQKMRRKMEGVYSFTHEMEAAGKTASSRILSFNQEKPPRDVARILTDNGYAEGTEVFRVIRIRMADHIPMLMETVFIPVAIIPGLTEERLQGNSLYDILRDDAGVVPVMAEESYESCLLEKSVCALLGCYKNTTGFSIQRIAYDKNERLYEITQSIMRGDRSKLILTLEQGNRYAKRRISEAVETEEE